MSTAPKPGPFATRADALAWLAHHRLDHLIELSAEVLLPQVERYRLIDLCSVEGVARQKYGQLELQPLQLPALGWAFFERELAALTEAHQQLEQRLAAPQPPLAFEVSRAFITLRETFSARVPPRPDRQLPLDALTVKLELPGFSCVDSRRVEAPGHFGFFVPRVTLTLIDGAAAASCTCGQSRCLHALAAVDTVLLWLQQPDSEAFSTALQNLTRTPWDRALQALETVFDASPGEVAELTWRVEIEDYELAVTPWVRKKTRAGTLSTGSKADPGKLAQLLDRPLSAADARIAELCEGRNGASLLAALVEHPRLVLASNPNRSITATRTAVGLVAEERNRTVVVSLGVDGTVLPEPLLERIRKGQHERPLFLWDAGPCRLEMLEVTREVRDAFSVLTRFGNSFPPESRAGLLQQLSKAATRLPVAMPRSVMGESTPPESSCVIRLELLTTGAVRFELRTRPLPESGPFLPGDGPRDVHVRRGMKALHAVRDFRAEVAAAKDFEERLPLRDAEMVSAFCYELASPVEALNLIEVCGRMEDAPQLEWGGPRLLVAGRGGPAQLQVRIERKREWFGVLGELSVNGERVELAVALDAARRRQRFVKVSEHTYVEMSQTLRDELERLADHVQASKHGSLIGPSGTPYISALSAAGANVSVDDEFAQLTQRIAAAKELPVAVPKTLHATLRDYQLDGFRWLVRLASWGAGAVLADDMGLGKTLQALALLLHRKSLGPALVLAPTSVGFNWVDEAKRFAPSLKVQLLGEKGSRKTALTALKAGDVVIASYGLAVRDSDALAETKFATLVLDEAQALKNATTQRVRAVRKIAADFTVAMTGTPLENHLGELWSLYRIVFPALFGSWESFRDRFARPIERGLDPAAQPQLARALQPFLLRRTKAEVATELPPRTEVRVPVSPSSAEFQLYEDARLALLSDLETSSSTLKEQERRLEVLAGLTRLRLLASHPRLYDPASTLESSKLTRLLELIDTLHAEGHRALVFSQFTSHLLLVREVLDARGIRYQYLDGSTPAGDREKAVRAFQDGSDPLFLISLKAGGFGLNLTSADNVIHLDPWWNPAVEDQASDRAHRIGQKKPVTVYRLISMGTIEEKMLALHQSKRALVAKVLEGKDSAHTLTSSELLELLSSR